MKINDSHSTPPSGTPETGTAASRTLRIRHRLSTAYLVKMAKGSKRDKDSKKDRKDKKRKRDRDSPDEDRGNKRLEKEARILRKWIQM